MAFRKNLWFVMMITVALLFAGCAKNGVDQVEEITPPEMQMEEDLGAPELEGPMVTMPGVEEEELEVAAITAPTLEDKLFDFESGDIYYGYDRFNLTPEARKVLAEKASFLNANADVKVRIEGHCDERGTREYNLALGERRAKSAQDYLIFLGIDASRISTVSYGEERPVDPAHNEAAWTKNRRAHFDVLGN